MTQVDGAVVPSASGARRSGKPFIPWDELAEQPAKDDSEHGAHDRERCGRKAAEIDAANDAAQDAAKND